MHTATWALCTIPARRQDVGGYVKEHGRHPQAIFTFAAALF
jgi:hypothetical protein